MKRLTFVMDSPVGLHVTEAGPLVKTAQQYLCTITLSHGDKIVDAKKMLSVLRLGAKYGDRITATFDGAYEQEAAEAFAAIVTPAE